VHAATVSELRAAIERATADLDGIVAVFQALPHRRSRPVHGVPRSPPWTSRR
jgi:hypothetical protein